MEIHFNSDLQFRLLDWEYDFRDEKQMFDIEIRENEIDPTRVQYFVSKHQGNLRYAAADIKKMIADEEKKERFVSVWYERTPEE